ncbi:AraC family transcriptional regulator [Cohnella nanjingensis]|uniref:Helix-turn-helix transcriptional regulator n=1 Tax=Cohnella nanjingensis TaxID=1387779 RepID=A0A7X0RW43_9BACL|nr:AraC family transcriptional regulator [Cohnella nanjingensis]MBB6674762.1 helix-turn-helix transcriptional regulator [Cohnella nanjingensis]
MAHGGGLFHAEWLDGEYRPRVHAYYFKQWSAYDMAYHAHDSTEIMYVMSDSCRVVLHTGEGRHESVALKKGEFIILNANVPHRLQVDKTCRMLNVEFGLTPSQGVIPSLRRLAAEDAPLVGLIRAPDPYLVLSDPDEVYHTLKSLVLELDLQSADAGMLAQLLLAQLLVRIARLRSAQIESGLPAADWYVRQTMAFMQQNYDRDIQVKDIAGAVNLHPSYLQRIFRAHSGQTLTEYLTAHRMEKAKMLLLHTDIPVADISEYVGVASRQYFHVLFKKYTGRTPVSFRQSVATQSWQGES